ncbi:MAG: ArsR/SmtB family transcription factor [Arthrobacter sp.]|uniref:ArsR/SmtB family transcription factor n=1 Tax=unclassified Arthrobacter TaxID=235627 RepID=UPI002652A4B1|nr:helix-turn-helix domain-containing protein [Micrococcaceae bacterium]MDN5812047.1 helix-turn-helix domain-containing protein [Micrococcaceae bacterium]MDN5824938.1 helix-turn-helix domain-containing protein [Micrococcaceae bacterium]MDN5879179.1 helix-turn-helix domain-containing protein [Micrococcaceae bacterium]MDN5886590.1 helix-turn-helix domain-containing protein [Micrococcaceae bacterium]
MASDDELQARARALSSPIRLRILRLCLHKSRTNKEIADLLEINPATSLHHVRTLMGTGFLESEEPRRGKRGAKEVPYRSTRMSWGTKLPDAAPVLLETFLQEINGLAPDEIQVMRVGLKLTEADQRELLSRIKDVISDYALRPSDDEGVATSLFVAHHLDQTAN